MNRTVPILLGALVAACLLVNLHWITPYYNWDLIPYLGVAERLGGAAPEESHELAYKAIRESVPQRNWKLLTASDEYRRTVADDPASFAQQLPFYSVKPAYPLLILALDRTGVNPVQASVLVSQAAYVGIGIILFVWLASFLPPVAAAVGAWGGAGLPFTLELARLSTPDALSTLIVLTALWLLVEQGRSQAGMLLLLLSIPVRPDNLLWLLTMGGYTGIRKRSDRTMAASVLVGGIVLYLVLARGSGNLGWTILFHHSFVERISYPGTFQPSLTAFEYLWIYLRESHPVNLPPFVMLFSLAGAGLLVHRLRQHGWRDQRVVLLGSIGLFFVLHWLVYPGEDRFFAPAYLLLSVVLVKTLSMEGQTEGAQRTPVRQKSGP